MKVSRNFLEKRVAKINTWLLSTPESNHAYKLEIQKRNYYVQKLCEMDNKQLETIKI